MENPTSRTLFIGVVALCVLGYTCFTLWQYWGYVQLDIERPIQNSEWTVQTKDEETHQLQATYDYIFNDVKYTGKYLFKKPVFINILGAEYAIKAFSSNFQKVWISSGNPSESSLERKFPLKEIVSTAVLWAIFLYFLGLRIYCNRITG